jgi:hypothetical protein
MTTLSVDNAAGVAQAMLTETISLDFQVSVDTHDTTTLGDDWKEFTAGLKGGNTFTHSLFYENTATTGTRAVYAGRLGIEGTLSFGDGVRTASMETIVTQISEPINVADMLKLSVTHLITGAVTFT